MSAHLAVDLGAESGRVFIGSCDGGVLSIQEIHRFSNQPLTCGNNLHWDVRRMWEEIRGALSSADVASIGVDAWGVDYALLDEDGELLQNPYHYRDPRNVPAMAEVLKLITKDEIYRETGVQFMPINTLYQLYAAKELLAKAHRMIMIPDLFHYWLSGSVVCEYTAASTTQLANPKTRDWSKVLLRALDLPEQLPAEIVEPGSIIGNFNGRTRVIAPGSHDTASAVAAISASGNTAFLSSGTWSLVGMELDAPIISAEAMRMNFTNEGGIAGTTRLLKNVMGLWMLQRCRKEWGQHQLSYEELTEAARRARAFGFLVDPDDASFLNPASMVEAVNRFCRNTDQSIPDSQGTYARGILESLALKYRAVIRNLESLIARRVEQIRIIGGGSKNKLLNQFTADATGKRVLAGPSEASVIGNVGVQMLAMKELSSLAEMRALVERSFATEIYEPCETDVWDIQADRFQSYAGSA